MRDKNAKNASTSLFGSVRALVTDPTPNPSQGDISEAPSLGNAFGTREPGQRPTFSPLSHFANFNLCESGRI